MVFLKITQYLQRYNEYFLLKYIFEESLLDTLIKSSKIAIMTEYL